MKKTIILVSGNAGAGKDTVFGMIKDLIPDIRQYTFAASLKHIVKDLSKIFLNAEFDVESMNSLEYKEAIRPEFTVYDQNGPRPLSIRHLLQNIGTEVMRNHLGADVFINATLDQIESDPDEKVVAITDLRFPNELSRVRQFCSEKRYKLIVIKVRRSSIESGYHESEKNIDKLPCDWIIENNQGLEDLREQVREIVRHALWSFVGHRYVSTLSS